MKITKNFLLEMIKEELAELNHKMEMNGKKSHRLERSNHYIINKEGVIT